MRQGSLFDGPLYPHEPGHKGGETSRHAAEDMASRAATLRGKVMRLLTTHDLTADECARALGENILAIRPRLSELHVLGAIFDTGERRRNVSTKRAIVWGLVRRGEE